MIEKTNITLPQQERLEFIDWCACFLGEVDKADICRFFAIKSAAATRDFSLYNKLYPSNIKLDMSRKVYLPTPTFRSRYQFTLDKVLFWLDKFGLPDLKISLLPLEKLAIPTPLNSGNISILTRAIHNKEMINILYFSLSSGSRERDIYPFALFNNALRWYVRAYDTYRERFIDFALGRIASVKKSDRAIMDAAHPENDTEWNSTVVLELRPHPGNVRHPDAIEREYNMKEHKLRIQTRSALAGYLLRAWDVDCTPDHSLKGNAYHLWLANRKNLADVSSLKLAPGVEGTEGDKR